MTQVLKFPMVVLTCEESHDRKKITKLINRTAHDFCLTYCRPEKVITEDLVAMLLEQVYNYALESAQAALSSDPHGFNRVAIEKLRSNR